MRLPFIFWVYRITGRLEPEIFRAETWCATRSVAIDIGANIGLWSYRLCRVFQKVHAFEVNVDVAADLRAYGSDQIQLNEVGLSSAEGEATLYIPVSKGVRLNGWASFQAGNCPDTNEHVTRKVPIRTLDSFAIQDVSFIKMDVEGHELEVLRGAVKTLRASRPVVLVEVKDTNVGAVSSFFRELDYDEIPLDDGTVLAGVASNRLFKPRVQPSA